MTLMACKTFIIINTFIYESFLQMLFSTCQTRSIFVSPFSKIKLGSDLIRTLRNLPLTLHQKALLRQLKKRESQSEGWKSLNKAGTFLIQN